MLPYSAESLLVNAKTSPVTTLAIITLADVNAVSSASAKVIVVSMAVAASFSV